VRRGRTILIPSSLGRDDSDLNFSTGGGEPGPLSVDDEFAAADRKRTSGIPIRRPESAFR
jgi:hypothetical protein